MQLHLTTFNIHCGAGGDSVIIWDTVYRHEKPNPNQLALSCFPSIAELVEKLFGCDIFLHQTLEVNLVGVRTGWQMILFPKCCPSVVI